MEFQGQIKRFEVDERTKRKHSVYIKQYYYKRLDEIFIFHSFYLNDKKWWVNVNRGHANEQIS